MSQTTVTDHKSSLLLAVKRIHELENELQRVKDSEAEVLALRQQLVALKERYEQECKRNQSLKTSPQDSAALEESQRKNKQMERVIHFLRERAETAQLETCQLQQELQLAREDIHQLKQRPVTISHATDSKPLELLQQMIDTVRTDKQHAEDALEKAKKTIEEKEQAIKSAQLHLTKKMKEVAVLTETYEQQRAQMADLQRSLTESQSRLATLQQALEQQQQHAQRLEEKMHHSTSHGDAQTKKWEEKYFEMYSKWQETESENRSLQAVAERHHQIQALLTHINSVLHTPIEIKETEEKPASKNESAKIHYKQTPFD